MKNRCDVACVRIFCKLEEQQSKCRISVKFCACKQKKVTVQVVSYIFVDILYDFRNITKIYSHMAFAGESLFVSQLF